LQRNVQPVTFEHEQFAEATRTKKNDDDKAPTELAEEDDVRTQQLVEEDEVPTEPELLLSFSLLRNNNKNNNLLHIAQPHHRLGKIC
jgi:hypothetical protein